MKELERIYTWIKAILHYFLLKDYENILLSRTCCSIAVRMMCLLVTIYGSFSFSSSYSNCQPFIAYRYLLTFRI